MMAHEKARKFHDLWSKAVWGIVAAIVLGTVCLLVRFRIYKKKAHRKNVWKLNALFAVAKPDSAERGRRGELGGVYYPNNYNKGHACCYDKEYSRNYNEKCKPCTKEKFMSCNGERGVCKWRYDPGDPESVAEPHQACWRSAFRYHMDIVLEQGGVFLQVIDENQLGNGQKEEIGWAVEKNMNIWHTVDGSKLQQGPWPGWVP